MTIVFKAAALVAALAVGAGSASAGEYQFVFLNDTSVPVLRMYVAPSSSEEWGDDILYDIGQVAPGDSATVTVTTAGDECLYDMRFEAPSGGEAEQFEQDICKMTSFRLHD